MMVKCCRQVFSSATGGLQFPFAGCLFTVADQFLLNPSKTTRVQAY
jgi:hypothetical protein